MTSESSAPPLYVRKVRGMGRGVFAGRAFSRGEVIEVCPVIPLPDPAPTDPGRVLERYVFWWGVDGRAIALGYGSLYNHSPEPNAKFTPRESRNDIVIRATRDIVAGEQIMLDYGWDKDDFESLLTPPPTSAAPAAPEKPAKTARKTR